MRDGERADTQGTRQVQDEIAQRRLDAALGTAASPALSARIAALCRRQIAAARPLLDRAAAGDDPADHGAVLDEFARDG